MPHEIIEELYIPEEDPFFDNLSYARTSSEGTRQGEIANGEDLLRHLLMEAYTLTDNEAELLPEGDLTNTWWIFGNQWTPSGNLKIWDDNAGQTTTYTKTFSHYEYYYCDTGEPATGPCSGGTDPNAKIDPINCNICQRAIYTYTANPPIQGKYVPLEGAQVLMRQWFTIRQGITDANGNFSTGTVRGNARYIIQWERHDYSIRSGWFGQAETRGPKQSNAWNYEIEGGKAEYYGHIHRAAHNYFYGNIDGLRRPPLNGFLKSQIKIAAYDTYDSDDSGRNDHYARLLNWLTPVTGVLQAWPTITLRLYDRPSTQIFGTTTHELAHSTHAKHAGPFTFIGSEERMIETYAQTIEWYLTTKYYRKYGISFPKLYSHGIGYDFGHDYGYQNKYIGRSDNDLVYTSLMVDLIDDFNQRVEFNNIIYPSDKVKNYTINQIETEVLKNKTFTALKNDLYNNYENSTKENLIELFNYWN